MDRLTRVEIAELWKKAMQSSAKEFSGFLRQGLVPNHAHPDNLTLPERFALLLQDRQSLSQEAVREEALEGAAEAVNHLALYGPPEYSLAFCQAVEAIRALKREPNAAAQAPLPARLGSDAKVDSRQVESATDASAYPAPAAPDVAGMVKRLRECCTMIGYATSGAERASHKRNADAAEAALLAKLGQEEYDCMICGGIVHGPFSKPKLKLHHRHSGKRPTFPAIECPKCGYKAAPGASDE